MDLFEERRFLGSWKREGGSKNNFPFLHAAGISWENLKKEAKMDIRFGHVEMGEIMVLALRESKAWGNSTYGEGFENMSVIFSSYGGIVFLVIKNIMHSYTHGRVDLELEIHGLFGNWRMEDQKESIT